MDSQRPKRVIKKPSRFLNSKPSVTPEPLSTPLPEVRRSTKRPLQALPAEPIPEDIQQQLPAQQREIPSYTPPLGRIEFRTGKALVGPIDYLSAFLLLLSEVCLQQIVVATNSYAQNAGAQDISEFARPWTPITRAELLRFIGCLFYMGLHSEKLRDDYWRPPSRLASFMSKNRFDQLRRYVHLRDKFTQPKTVVEGFQWKVEPVASTIRTNCMRFWFPATHVVIDESMLPFCGRSEDTIKMKNKPIEEGFKVWVLGDQGYVYNWLWFSGHEKKGTEIIGLKSWKCQIDKDGTVALFAPTHAVIIYLAQLLVTSVNSLFVLVLDNLFLNVPVARALLFLNVACCGTTRKNASGFPPDLIRIKEHNRLYLWDSCIARIIENVLCFAWQDNNTVLGLTTAHSLHRAEDTISRDRKRPKLTSTNAKITRPIFGDYHRKALEIPGVIDDYNHHMNGVDLANQLRAWMTCQRPGVYKPWQPLWYWLLDICACNAYLIWKSSHLELDQWSTRLHRKFQEGLIDALLHVPDERPTPIQTQVEKDPSCGHRGRRMPSMKNCTYCLRQTSQKRRFGTEIINEAQPNRARRSNFGCIDCDVNLCKEGPCWDQWHAIV